MKVYYPWLVACVAVLLAGCQTYAPLDFDRLSAGTQVSRVTTDLHQHLIISRPARKSSNRLHVYIEGDGVPWLQRFFIAKDPTPRHALALELMRRDTNHHVLYLGRPCYFNSVQYGLEDEGCDSTLWTSARYSSEVVASMVAALYQAVDVSAYEHLVLIGHSGGGTLAMLMGHEIPETDQIVTIAANLDIDAWTKHHRYTRLRKSLNPAQHITHTKLKQVHLAGGKDEVVPPELNADFLGSLGYPLTIIDDYDHSCCWLNAWPQLLYSVVGI